MQITFALNSVIGSALIVILVFADYIRKYHTDRAQKAIFCSLLFFIFIAMMCNMANYLFRGDSGEIVYLLLLTLNTFYFIFKMLAYYYFLLFADYIIYKDSERTKKITAIVYAVNILHLALLLINLKWTFYFYIDQSTNIFHYGRWYFVHLFIGYSPIVFSVYELTVRRKQFRRSHLVMLLLLVGLSALGSTADVLLGTVKLIWPCLTSTLLYSYFFIIQIDTRLDSLTGIGNRYSFNEFTDRLSRRSTGESWAIVMIDMDHFKEINDTLGHHEGDNALRDMSAIIKNLVGPQDFIARYGGDEFVVATRAENGIGKLMSRIQEEVDLQNEKKIRPFKLEISYGFDVYTADGKNSFEDFLNHIDSLMYRNKERRRRASDKKKRAAL
jgi:diguanylate cyclase (GGDEF)-like protein